VELPLGLFTSSQQSKDMSQFICSVLQAVTILKELIL
jgi:fumarate reductase subunit D